MPKRLQVRRLDAIASKRAAWILGKTLKRIDDLFKSDHCNESIHSPSKAYARHKRRCHTRNNVTVDDTPSRQHILEASLRDWLSLVPVQVYELILKEWTSLTEFTLDDDKDRRIVMALINIETTKPSDLFFGVHALFRILESSCVTRLPFSNRFWYCLQEYDQITNSNLIAHQIIQSLPNLTDLVVLNVSHVANNDMCRTIAENLTHLRDLTLDHSDVTDSGLGQLVGDTEPLAAAVSDSTSKDMDDESPKDELYTGGWAINHLRSSDADGLGQCSDESHQVVIVGAEEDDVVVVIDSESNQRQSHSIGCRRRQPSTVTLQLKFLSLEGCQSVSDRAVWHTIQRIPTLTVVRYQQYYSLAEIINREVQRLSLDEASQTDSHPVLNLTHYAHPFPYKLDLSQDMVCKLNRLCPHITHINLITSDASLEQLAMLPNLTHVHLEIEDCFGLGLDNLLHKRGPDLVELVISCSSDPDSVTVDGGGQSFQLFNAGLQLARIHCGTSSDRASKLTTLNIAGCGLVSNALLSRLASPAFCKDSMACIFVCPMCASMSPDGQIVTTNTSPCDHACAHWKSMTQNSVYALSELQVLILMSYEDDTPVQTCQSTLLSGTIHGCPKLQCLNLEGNFTSFMTDAYMSFLLQLEVLDVERHLALTTIDISGYLGVPLTMKSVKSCLDRLVNIDQLRIAKWAVSNAEMDELATQIKAEGWDLSLGQRCILPSRPA